MHKNCHIIRKRCCLTFKQFFLGWYLAAGFILYKVRFPGRTTTFKATEST